MDIIISKLKQQKSIQIDAFIKLLTESYRNPADIEGALIYWVKESKNTPLNNGCVAAMLYNQFRKSRNTLIYVKAVQLWNKFVINGI